MGDWMESTGNRPGGRPRTGWDAVTNSEWRVVELAARGATNPQIAAELFVSPETVKSHLKSVFRKLGVRSRTELATAVVRRCAQDVG